MENQQSARQLRQVDLGGGRRLDVFCTLLEFGGQPARFSVASVLRNPRFPRGVESLGCSAELVANHIPELGPMLRLNLCNLDGVPMHAAANAWHLAGGQRGPGTRPPDPAALSAHLRIGRTLAEGIVQSVASGGLDMAGMTRIVELQKPRWKAEAALALSFLQTGIWPGETGLHRGQSVEDAPAPRP